MEKHTNFRVEKSGQAEKRERVRFQAWGEVGDTVSVSPPNDLDGIPDLCGKPGYFRGGGVYLKGPADGMICLHPPFFMPSAQGFRNHAEHSHQRHHHHARGLP